jgi:hypothetical protein
MVDFEYSDEQQPVDTEIAVFLDGFAYSGIVNLQDITQKWPATAGRDIKQYDIAHSITKQASVPNM